MDSHIQEMTMNKPAEPPQEKDIFDLDEKELKDLEKKSLVPWWWYEPN